MRHFDDINDLCNAVGEPLGMTDWRPIDQARIQRFADATDDHQWIHVDVARAERESVFGAPVAHGFLTLSLLPALAKEIFTVGGVRTQINYGLDMLRFPAPVLAGQRVRAELSLISVEPRETGQYRVKTRVVVAIEHGDKPALVADTLNVYLV